MIRKSRGVVAVAAGLLLSQTLACAIGGSAPKALPQKSAAFMEMVFVPGGCFQMGSAADGPGGPEEKPQHEVCVDDFYIGKHEVTQGQWSAVMGSNPSAHKDCGTDCPVEMVSWNDAQEFISKLNGRSTAEERSKGQYRLPTEAEWEYAARSRGQPAAFSPLDDGASNDDEAAVAAASAAWYVHNTTGPRPVGTKAPSELGLHDMSGNVWEWTNDWWDATYYSKSPRNNPPGPSSGDRRVLRGGGFENEAFELRASYRNYLPPDFRSGAKGLRLLRSATAQAR